MKNIALAVSGRTDAIPTGGKGEGTFDRPRRIDRT